jgi:hypothetical protein
MAIEQKRVRLKPTDSIDIGKMYLFEYDPKWKDALPYYDKYPLAIPIDYRDDGFIAMNLHYLASAQRRSLFEALKSNRISDYDMSDDTHFMLSYEIVKGYGMTFEGYTTCLKRYLYAHVRSPFGLIDPENWDAALEAPLARWITRGTSKRKR